MGPKVRVAGLPVNEDDTANCDNLVTGPSACASEAKLATLGVRAMTPQSRQVTTPYSIATAIVSFIMQPIPAADELAVVPMHYWFAGKLAKAHGVRRRDLPWRSIQKIIWYGAGARLGANFSLGLVPVVGAFANAVTAAALTELLGGWLDAYLADPNSPPPDITMEGLMKIFARAQKNAEPEAARS